MTASEGKLSRFLAKFCNCAYTIGYIYLEGIVYTMLLNLVWYLMNGWGRFVCSVCINKYADSCERERERLPAWTWGKLLLGNIYVNEWL